MQNRLNSVKRRIGGGCVILALFAGLSCATPQSFASHPNYLAMDLPVGRYEELRKKIEKDTRESLKTRHEAHITVITPPEWDLLKDKLTMKEVDELAHQAGFPEVPFETVCVGHGEKKEGSPVMKTYYVVVKSDGLLKLRQKIQDLHEKRGGSSAFDAKHFFPHITVGFTHRDLHEQDGVIKSEDSCDYRWKF